MRYLIWFWHNSRGIRWNTAFRILAGIMQAMLGLLMVWLSRRFIDETIRTGTTSEVTQMVLLLVATVLGGLMFRLIYYYMTTLARVRQNNLLRLRMFSSLFRRPLFDGDELHSGDVTSRLSKDIEAVCDATTSTMPQIAITSIQLAGAFLLMRWFDARLAWALLLLTPIAVIGGKLVSRRLRQMTLDIRRDESLIQMHVQEGMEHNAVLRSLQSEQWVTERLDSMQQRLKGNVKRRTRFTVVARLLIGSTFGLGYLLAFVWGGLGLRNGTITFGVMTSFLQLVGMIQHPILSMLNMIPGLIHATASIDRLDEMEQKEVDSSKTVGQKSDVRVMSADLEDDTVQFDDVTFRYAKGDREILSHFNHVFLPGSKTAILGETGIGKTTIFRLMLGLIQPDSGRVVVGSRTAKDPTDIFCFVPQGNTLMSGTIRYNLQLAKPDAADAELEAVLHTACADFVLDLPDGLDFCLGERGGGLSEGQSQRIAIARGLLRQGTILLLDEISSSLDEQTERELFTRMLAAYPQKTMIFITHRPSVSTLCDETLNLGSR